MPITPPWPRIVFFDGICVLCNSTVDFLIRHDKGKKLKYASLQSDLARDLLPGLDVINKGPDSVLFLENGKIRTRSEAIIRIMYFLPFPWNSAVAFKILPEKFRNRFYDWIATNRYKWFGIKDSCRIPDKSTEESIIG